MMLEEFIGMIINSGKDEKCVIHCSAGIGRTGTTISLAHLIINICAQKNKGIADPSFSVFSIVRRIRE
jgi:protein tyrosine phosphatase